MPSFRVAERWVRDTERPEPVRFLGFCWALESYAWLTGQRWHATYKRLGAHLGFDWDHKPSGEQMIAAVEILHLERERVKERRLRTAAMRREEKRAGRRQPRPGTNDWVYEPDFLEIPLPAPAG